MENEKKKMCSSINDNIHTFDGRYDQTIFWRNLKQNLIKRSLSLYQKNLSDQVDHNRNYNNYENEKKTVIQHHNQPVKYVGKYYEYKKCVCGMCVHFSFLFFFILFVYGICKYTQIIIISFATSIENKTQSCLIYITIDTTSSFSFIWSHHKIPIENYKTSMAMRNDFYFFFSRWT